MRFYRNTEMRPLFDPCRRRRVDVSGRLRPNTFGSSWSRRAEQKRRLGGGADDFSLLVVTPPWRKIPEPPFDRAEHHGTWFALNGRDFCYDSNMKILSMQQLIAEMRAVARGEKPAPADAAEPKCGVR
jgi:hypothetical protein